MTRNNRIAFAVFLFFALEILLMSFVDRPLSEYLRTVDVQDHGLINFFRAFTDLGKSKWYLWPSALGINVCALLVRLPSVRKKTRANARRFGEALLFFFACIAVSGIVADIIKYFVGRARPVLLQREHIYGFHPMMTGSVWRSWPSGHSTTAFALAFALVSLFPGARILWLAFAVFIAISRVMVNAHFLSDVIAGAVVGTLTVAAFRAHLNHNGINHIRECIFPIDKARDAA